MVWWEGLRRSWEGAVVGQWCGQEGWWVRDVLGLGVGFF